MAQNCRDAADRHGLQIDAARSGDDGVENALAAEEHVFDARNAFDLHGAARVHGGEIAGVDDNGLTGLQVVFLHMAVKFAEDRACAGELLENEALAAEEARAELLLEEDRELDAGLAREEPALLHDQFSAGGDLKGTDIAREARSKSDQTRAALGGVAVLEHRLACKHAAEGLANAAARGGLHLHVGAHPAHAAALGDHRFLRVQIADDDRQGRAFNGVFHDSILLKNHLDKSIILSKPGGVNRPRKYWHSPARRNAEAHSPKSLP